MVILTPRDEFEIKEIIRQYYANFLEREPDIEGFKYYFNKIKNKEIKIEDLESIFTSSNEYKVIHDRRKKSETIDSELAEIFAKSTKFEPVKNEEQLPEPKQIVTTCFHQKTHEGGIYQIKENELVPIFEKTGCYGIFLDKTHQTLFCLTRENPQILAFKILDNGHFKEIPIKFLNYIFAEKAHGICIFNNQILIVGTSGDKNKIKTSNNDFPSETVGKIIVSKIEFQTNNIIINDSKSYNPFDCSHHHHINDVVIFQDQLLMSSLSYCDQEKNYIKKGVLSKLDTSNFQAKVLNDKFVFPHSCTVFRDRLFLCSSLTSSVISIDNSFKDMKLEYKGIDVFVRGLVVTDNFFYIGNSQSIGRTKSPFKNPSTGIIQVNRKTGETKRITLPVYCDNVYDIVSIS
tara:strand:+ start:202 stop:1410 length:1209 start_codon:yes stop_codon:yes gene_type:complete